MSDLYTPASIESKCRTLMNDKVAPYFVSQEEFYDALNRMMREVAEEALVLPTADEIRVVAKADTAYTAKPDEVIKLRCLNFPNKERSTPVSPLPFSQAAHAQGTTGWRDSAARLPDFAIQDMRQGYWRWLPVQTEDVELTVEGWVYPTPVKSSGCHIELPDRVARHLHLGILAELFDIEDADAIYDPKKAASYLQKWEFAKDRMVSLYERDRRDGGRTVRYGGY